MCCGRLLEEEPLPKVVRTAQRQRAPCWAGLGPRADRGPEDTASCQQTSPSGDLTPVTPSLWKYQRGHFLQPHGTGPGTGLPTALGMQALSSQGPQTQAS